MKSNIIEPVRKFRVGVDKQIEISHCANITLEPDEQITLVTESGNEYDVARKAWGYYATPSTNGRLRSHNLRTALVKNSMGQLYVMLCEIGKEDLFNGYLEKEKQHVLIWLDSDDALKELENRVSQS